MRTMILTAWRSRVMWIGLLGFVVCIAVSLGVAGAPGQAYQGADLGDLIAQFQTRSSLSFSASVEAMFFSIDAFLDSESFVPPAGVPIFGRLEYTASGDRYKIVSDLEPDKYPGLRTQVAYDGEKFQLLLDSNFFAYCSQDKGTAVPVLPNPILELLQFRYPTTEDNYGLELRLKDIWHDTVPEQFRKLDLTAVKSAEWTEVREGNDFLSERAVFAGGTYLANRYVHHVFVQPGHRNLPVRIDRVFGDGERASTEFSDYVRLDSANGPSFWPQTVVLRTFKPGGAEVARVSFAISDIAVDVEYPQAAFVIDPAGATNVWDEDRGAFVPTDGE